MSETPDSSQGVRDRSLAQAPSFSRRLTVAVCTRNRPDLIATVVTTLLASVHPDFEVLVVDQSPGRETEVALGPRLQDPRLRYHRDPGQGLGRARNVALRLSHAEVVAMTDDDCEAPPEWLSSMERLFLCDPSVAVAYCSVLAGPHDPAAGFVPAYSCDGERRVTRLRDYLSPHGIGAGMAVRRTAVSGFGGFDECLGAGGRFLSYEDADIALRALLFGHAVHETGATSVLHHGFRTWQQGRALGYRDWVGVGAGHAKLWRCRAPGMARVAAHELRLFVLGPALAGLVRGRPQGITRGRGYVRGFLAGLRAPIDRRTACFRAEAP